MFSGILNLQVSFYNTIFFLFSGSVLKEFSFLNENKTRNIKKPIYFYRKRQIFHQKILYLDNSGFWKDMIEVILLQTFFPPFVKKKGREKKI